MCHIYIYIGGSSVTFVDNIKYIKPKYITCTTIAYFTVTRIIIYYNHNVDHIFPSTVRLLIGSTSCYLIHSCSPILPVIVSFSPYTMPSLKNVLVCCIHVSKSPSILLNLPCHVSWREGRTWTPS
jgi:hypothetical protein